MQNENLQQGGTPQKRTITDGAASVITRAEALAYALTIQGANIPKLAAPALAETRLALEKKSGRSFVIRLPMN